MAADDRPPFFKTWNGAYAFVLAWLVICMVAFAIVTEVYR
jgi:hypothetical protein